jgi:D-alanyl-D-alanine carboxypeptidase
MEQPSPQSGAVQYGLGLVKFDTPCGVFYGHDGSIFGYEDMVVGSADGRRQGVLGDSPYQLGNPGAGTAKAALLDAEMCGTE